VGSNGVALYQRTDAMVYRSGCRIPLVHDALVEHNSWQLRIDIKREDEKTKVWCGMVGGTIMKHNVRERERETAESHERKTRHVKILDYPCWTYSERLLPNNTTLSVVKVMLSGSREHLVGNISMHASIQIK
jgi:hypothetical protein